MSGPRALCIFRNWRARTVQLTAGRRAQGFASGDDDDDDVSDDDGDLVFGVGEDDPAFAVGEVTGSAGDGLGMAAESVLRSIPPHRLRALEKLQSDASEFNRATRVRRPRGAGALGRPGPPRVRGRGRGLHACVGSDPRLRDSEAQASLRSTGPLCVFNFSIDGLGAGVMRP